jgi:hypothetical protein
MGQKQFVPAPTLAEFPEFLEAIENNDLAKAKEIHANTEAFQLQPDILKSSVKIYCKGDKLYFNKNKPGDFYYFSDGSLLRYGISAGVSLEMFKFFVEIVDPNKAWRNMIDHRFNCEYILDYALQFYYFLRFWPDERSKNSKEIFFYILHNYQEDKTWMRDYLFETISNNKFKLLTSSESEVYLDERHKLLYLCCLAKRGVRPDLYETLFPDSPEKRSELIEEEIKYFYINV